MNTRKMRKISDVNKNGGRPTDAQRKLIEQYNAYNEKNIVDNEIDQIVGEQIFSIQEFVNNIIKYGDNSIFKVIPKELDEKLKFYGLLAKRYFGKKLKDLEGKEVFIIPSDYKQCSKCGDFKDRGDFYKSFSDTSDGVTHICKSCSKKLFKEYVKKYKDIKECLILISSKLDIVIDSETLDRFIYYYNSEEGKDSFVKGSFLGSYIGELWIKQHVMNIPKDRMSFSDSNLGGIPFKCITPYDSVEIYDDVLLEQQPDDKEDNLKEKRKLESKWGQYPIEDLKWLELRYNNYLETYEIDDLSKEILVIQLCFEEFNINKKRNEEKETAKGVKTLRELMKDCDFTRKSKKSDDDTASFSSLGALIKHVETNRPIINKRPEFVDVDKIERIWKSMSGAIARTLGKKNEYTEFFETEYAKYTSDLMENQGDNNEEE